MQSVKDLRKFIERTAVDTNRCLKAVKELNGMMLAGEESNAKAEDGKNKFQQMQDDIKVVSKQALRIENIMGLPPLSKDEEENGGGIYRNGTRLTDQQVEDFKVTFERFDIDHSGNISTDEICDVMKHLQFDVPADVMDYIIKDVDDDGDGEINFDEFCTLMAKILGPDGNVDVEAYVKMLSGEATQKQFVEMVPILKETMTKQQEVINEEQQKLEESNNRLQFLEAEFASLVNEVVKMRKGLQLNSQNWKGFADGFKDTKKIVQVEGEGEMMPSAGRLRTLLPSLTPRPGSANGDFRPCTSAGPCAY